MGGDFGGGGPGFEMMVGSGIMSSNSIIVFNSIYLLSKDFRA